MKIFRMLLLGVVLLFCQNAFAQALISSVTIKFNGGKYSVSGVVTSEALRSEVTERIKSQLGASGDFGELRLQSEARVFPAGWQAALDKSLVKIKDWKSGVFIFSNRKPLDDTSYPLLPRGVANVEIRFTDGQKVSLQDYKNKVVVLFFFASWVMPGRLQAIELNKFYRSVSKRNVEIIGISGDDDPDERRLFPLLGKNLDLQYKLGFINPALFPQFVAISKLNGVPQAFVIVDGRLRGVFAGYTPGTQQKLEETVLKILDENNL